MSNRTVVITGATGGMGRETALRFARNGDRVAVLDLDLSKLEQLVGDITSEVEGADVLAVACNVGEPQSVIDARASVADWSPSVHVLALLAGIVAPTVPIAELSVEDWDRVQNVNLRGNFLMMKEFIPLMPHHDGASIVAIASWYGQAAHAYFSTYCASKAGVISLIQSAADELAPVGIRANSISPGNIDTEMHRVSLKLEAEQRGITFEELKDIEWAKIPLGIAGPPSTIVDAIEFLTSEKASYITGTSLDVNGGVMFN